MDTIVDQLKTVGLNEKQAKCYLALTELGEATAYQIAQKAKLKRPITYIILDELRRKGLALKIPHPKKQVFIPKPPDEFFAEYEEKFRNAKRILPDLLATANRKNRKVRVLYYEGKGGIPESFSYKEHEINGKELLAFYGRKSDTSKPISPVYEAYAQTRFEKGIKVRGFAPDHVSLKKYRDLDKKYGTKMIVLKESEFSAETSIEIIDSFVRISLYKDSQAVIIDNPDFAKTMREIFEMVWKEKNK
jgi:sugar-specific transcriptional regulator TrmB